MDYRDLIDQYYKLQERAAQVRKVIRPGNQKQFSQSNCSSNSGASTPDYMRDSPLENPIIPYSKQLEMMEREQQQLQADRVQKLVERSFLQEERQEAILKRLRKGQSGSFHSDTSSVSHCAPLDKRQGPQIQLRAISALRTPVPPPALAKPSRLPSLLTLHKRAKPTEKPCEVPVSWKDSTVSVARQAVKLEPIASKPRVGAQVNRRQGSGACCEAIGNRAASNAAGSGWEQQPEPPSKPAGGKAGMKAARFSQGAATSFKPAEKRDTARAAAISQGKGAVAETLSLVREQPLARPELALSQAFQLLEDEDWEKKIAGLALVRSLAQHHADILLANLHDVCLAVVEEVKNLRSMVSRAAMTTLAHMFAYLRRAMDPKAAEAARVLLHKAGESSVFIREDADLALGAMVRSCSAKTAMHALLAGGLSHRNAAVRKTTAVHLESLAQLLGASNLLRGKDLTERFLTAISRLALDAAQEVRFHARNCMKFLATHKDLVKMVEKFVPPKDRSSVKDIIMKGR